jgi:predicted lactoylglutathione lyase
MLLSTVAVSLPIADRRTAHEFYRRLLGREAIGEPAADGVPEPLQFALNDGMRLLMAPTGGFARVIGERQVAPPEQSEMVLSMGAESDADVDEVVERALAAGAALVSAPAARPWGYTGAFADPDGHVWMVTSAPLPG